MGTVSKKNQNKCDSWLILKQVPKNMSESVLRPLLVSVSESVSGPKKFTKKVFYAVSDGWHQETSIIEWLLTWSWKQLMRFVYNCSEKAPESVTEPLSVSVSEHISESVSGPLSVSVSESVSCHNFEFLGQMSDLLNETRNLSINLNKWWEKQYFFEHFFEKIKFHFFQ